MVIGIPDNFNYLPKAERPRTVLLPPWSASIGSPRRLEDAIRRAVFDHIGAHGARGLVARHTPNGGKRNAVEAAALLLQGRAV
jgi:hypothetical protein